jgi:hypothetical protein
VSTTRSEHKGRAYVETLQWNRSMISSLRHTAFRPFAVERKRVLQGRIIVEWKNIRDELKNMQSADRQE